MSFTSLAKSFVRKLCNLNPTTDEFNSRRVALVHEHVHRFIVSEVKMPCSCYPKAKAIHSRVRKQDNCPSFGTKSTSSRIPTEHVNMVGVDLHGQYKTRITDGGRRTVDGERLTTDGGRRTADYGLRTGYKTQTYV